MSSLIWILAFEEDKRGQHKNQNLKTKNQKPGLQYSLLAVFVGFLYSSLAVPGLYLFLEYSRQAGNHSEVPSKRRNINLTIAALYRVEGGQRSRFREASRSYEIRSGVAHRIE